MSKITVIRSRLPQWTLAGILAFGALPALAQEPSSMVVVRDPQTGELRAPTAAELQALRAAQRPSPAQQPTQSKSVVRPDGTRSLNLGERGMTYTTLTRNADGKLVEQCLHGEPPLAGAGATPQSAATPSPAAAPTSGKEHRHDHQ